MKSVAWLVYSAFTQLLLLPFFLVVFLFYALPAWIGGWMKLSPPPLGTSSLPWLWFQVQEGKGPAWWQKYWSRWGGWTGPGMVFVRTWNEGTINHELRHVYQYILLGPLFLLAYGLIYLCTGYEDNVFEVDARAHADGKWRQKWLA